jgi:EAL domain-containing protein (putative c-di-GMP-specific phosphodiesterase class I)
VLQRTLLAGEFLPWAARASLVGDIDFEIVTLALDYIRSKGTGLSVTLGFQSVCDAHQTQRLSALLARYPAEARLLALDVHEEIAFGQPAVLRDFCAEMHKLGPRVGIKDLDGCVGQLSKLQGAGFAYIKVSRALLQDVSKDEASRTLLRGLCTIIHLKGLQAYGSGVTLIDDVAVLFDLGFDGVSGTAIT